MEQHKFDRDRSSCLTGPCILFPVYTYFDRDLVKFWRKKKKKRWKRQGQKICQDRKKGVFMASKWNAKQKLFVKWLKLHGNRMTVGSKF